MFATWLVRLWDLVAPLDLITHKYQKIKFIRLNTENFFLLYGYLTIYIYFAFLSVYLSAVCPFVNFITQILCGAPHNPSESSWMIEFSKIDFHQNSIFENLKIHEIFYINSAKGIESLPHTRIFPSLYLFNLMAKTFDISNLGFFI